MRKIFVIVLAGCALVALIIAGIAFGLGYEPVAAKPPSRTITLSPRPTPTVALPPSTEYTVDATIGDIPTWVTHQTALIKVHTIHVWMATATCMKAAGFADFHYRIFWKPVLITPTSENFWTAGMPKSDATKALTAEFGPQQRQGGTTGCYNRSALALEHKYLMGK